MKEMKTLKFPNQEEAYEIVDSYARENSLPISGGVLTGALTVMNNLNVNTTYDSTEYKTYVRPINYSIGNNGDYATGLIHYKGDANQAQLMFNKDGVMFRDNVNSKAYQLFGQHNISTLATALGATKIQTGSYTGTGTYGSDNPCSLTFNFVPKLVAIIAYTGTTGNWTLERQGNFVPYELLTTSYQAGLGLTRAAASTTAQGKCSDDRKTFYWYQKDNDTAANQYNHSGLKYFWVAIG